MLTKEQKNELREAIVLANNPDCKTIDDAQRKVDYPQPYLINCLQKEQLLAEEDLPDVDMETDSPLVWNEVGEEDDILMIFRKKDIAYAKKVALGRVDCTLSRVLVALGEEYLGGKDGIMEQNDYSYLDGESDYNELCPWDLAKNNLFEQSEPVQEAIYNIICKK